MRTGNSNARRRWLAVFSLAALATTAVAQEAGLQTDALVLVKDRPPQEVALISATKSIIRFRPLLAGASPVDLKLSADASVYVCKSQDFADAMDLYQGGKYHEAKAKFIEVKKRHAPVRFLDDSHSSLAAFYELECLRQTGDLEGLAVALQQLPEGALTREIQLRQLEIYILWDAVRSRSWERLEVLAADLTKMRLPCDQRAQVSYCHGLALEGLGRHQEALLPYHVAITAGAGSSEVASREAALRILEIYLGDPEVQAALKVSSPPDSAASQKGGVKLAEAQAIVAVYEKSHGGRQRLPVRFKVFAN